MATEVEAEPYRFDFGKHRGKLVEEVPPDYLEWLIRKDVPSSRPDLREALLRAKPPVTNSPPAIPGPRDAVSSEYSSIQPGVLQSAAQTSGANYVVTFGKHNGKKLSEIPTSYLLWLSDNPTFKPPPALQAALLDFGIGLTSTAPMSLISHRMWSPPLLPYAPARFHDWYTEEALWITTSDVKVYFGFSEDYLRLVPTLPSDQSHKTKHWLYHVWDLARVCKGRNEAEKAFEEFLNKNRRREQEISHEMGLVPLC
jgi:uncharacterized protein (DUF3820 family)